MSYWTHILGVIQVSVIGRTQHEKTYILNTVLDHLPIVSGSERDMNVIVNVSDSANTFCTHDEFDMMTDNLTDRYGNKTRERGWLKYSDTYYLTVYGNLRDRFFKDTFREFQKWLSRLSKRINVETIDVTITSDDRKQPYHFYYDYDSPYDRMFEEPSWVNKDGEPAWFEYLMWEREPYSSLPLMHVYKYYSDEKIDKEIERRNKWKKGEEI